MIDHRASPGIRCDMPELGEGKMFEAPTLGCPHCQAVVVMNPKRTRERGFCSKCNRYVCDFCYAMTRKSGYVHRSFMELADMVRSGKYGWKEPRLGDAKIWELTTWADWAAYGKCLRLRDEVEVERERQSAMEELFAILPAVAAMISPMGIYFAMQQMLGKAAP